MWWPELDLYADDLWALCRTYAARVRADPDELFSDVVVEKYPQVFRCWDPSKGPFRLHLRRSMRWYMHKHVSRRRPESAAVIQHSIPTRAVDLEAALVLEEVLDRIPEHYAELLRWRYLKGYSLSEIGEHLNITKRWAGVLCTRALRAAQEVACED